MSLSCDFKSDRSAISREPAFWTVTDQSVPGERLLDAHVGEIWGLFRTDQTGYGRGLAGAETRKQCDLRGDADNHDEDEVVLLMVCLQ